MVETNPYAKPVTPLGISGDEGADDGGFGDMPTFQAGDMTLLLVPQDVNGDEFSLQPDTGMFGHHTLCGCGDHYEGDFGPGHVDDRRFTGRDLSNVCDRVNRCNCLTEDPPPIHDVDLVESEKAAEEAADEDERLHVEELLITGGAGSP